MLDTHCCVVTKDVDISCLHLHVHASMHVLFFLCILFMQSYYNALVLCFLFVHFTNLHLQGSPQNTVCPLREAGMYS